jgi:S1-C subfamily serine protease
VPEPTAEPPAEASWADLAAAEAAIPSRSRHHSSSKKAASGSGKAARSRAKDSGSTRRPQRAAGTIPLPGWAIAAILGGVLLFIGGVVSYVAMSGVSEPPKVAKKKPTKSEGKPKTTSNTGGSLKMDRPEGMPSLADGKRPPANAPLEDIFAWVKPGIVVLEVFDGGQEIGMGSGFVVDPAGVLVTNYHVTSSSDLAYAKFTDGSRYEVAGYLAVKPEWDLAVLQLKEKPPELRVLKLAYDNKPREASKVMAVGSPLGHTFVPTSGIVGRVVQAAHLPDSARMFVRLQTGDDEQFWIEHDAKIAPGNSGGPLFNMAGDVVGVNSWVDESVHFGYAIWSWYVHDLLSKKLPQAEPLSKYKKIELTGDSLAADLKPEVLQKLFDELEAIGWHPTDTGQFGRVQEFAKLVSIGRRGAALGLPKAVPAKALELSTRLAAASWKTDEQIKPINKLAVAELSKPATGTMLFGKIKVKQSARSESGSFTLLIVELEGESQLVAVPVSGVEATFAEGTRCLVTGLVSTGTIAFATPAEGRMDATLL